MPDEKKSAAFHDLDEEAAIAAIVEALPDEHAARIAFHQGVDPIQLSRLVQSEDIAKKIRLAYADGYARGLQRQRSLKS